MRKTPTPEPAPSPSPPPPPPSPASLSHSVQAAVHPTVGGVSSSSFAEGSMQEVSTTTTTTTTLRDAATLATWLNESMVVDEVGTGLPFLPLTAPAMLVLQPAPQHSAASQHVTAVPPSLPALVGGGDSVMVPDRAPVAPPRNQSLAVVLMMRAASKRRTLAYQRARASQTDVGIY